MSEQFCKTCALQIEYLLYKTIIWKFTYVLLLVIIYKCACQKDMNKLMNELKKTCFIKNHVTNIVFM